jgi:hypothetical protein
LRARIFSRLDRSDEKYRSDRSLARSRRLLDCCRRFCRFAASGHSVEPRKSRGQKAEVRSQKSETRGQAEIRDQRAEVSSYFLLPTSYFLLVLCWLAFVEIGCEAWYRAHERNLVATTRWDVQWPETAPDFHELKIDEEVRRALRFDQGHAASWTWPAASSPEASSSANSKKIACLLYLFRWNAGRNSAILASSHRPEVCLPAGGWKPVADRGVRTYPTANSFALPFRHFEFRHGTPGKSTQQMAHAFYCLFEDRTPSPAAASEKRPQMAALRLRLTRNERIRQVLEGRRHLGQQVMEVVFVSRDQLPADAESRLGELVREVVLAKPGRQ